MSISIQSKNFPLSVSDINLLWEKVREMRTFPNEEVVVRSVSGEEIQKLNKQYRGKDKTTNVLTFSYAPDEAEGEKGTHDVALCLAVAQEEAAERSVPVREYVALLLVHAFLHVAGMDHERDAAEAAETERLERVILEQAGFSSLSL